MRVPSILAAGAFFYCYILAAQSSDAIRKMESGGDISGARSALARSAEANPNDSAALIHYAEFLERYGDPAARQVYTRALTRLRQQNSQEMAGVIARRLAVLDLEAGDRDAAARNLEAFQSITGKALKTGTAQAAESWPTAPIPGPLRSFARMAAMPAETAPAQILQALARNVVTNGYQASHSNDELEQTEFLKLIHRYLSQAHELEKLAGDKQVIEVPGCESPNAAELLRILGFRMRGGCGSEVILETVNATRAFLTTDSGFPVNELEQALRTNKPFQYDYRPTMVPVLFGPDYWTATKDNKGQVDFLEAFISDPSICRLYLGFSKLDPETADALKKAATYARLRAYSHVLDFFGGMFEVRGGKAVVPGGARTASTWAELAGTSPDQGGAFLDKLLSKDDGWLASLYDALARIHGPARDYLVEPARMKRFYNAIRGHITSPGPARPVFRANTDMMLLTTRLQIESNGRPHVPGGIEVWKELFTNNPQAKYDGKLTRAATSWKDADDVLEALFGLSRKMAENEPLKIFMAISDVDRNRPKPLDPETVRRLTRSFRSYGSQYSIFAESRELTDKSILAYLDTVDAISRIRDPEMRANVAGTFESLIGLWQIFVRQRDLPSGADAAFSTIVTSFAQVRGNRELFDAGRSGVKVLLAAVPQGRSTALESEPQERIIDLMAGAALSEDAEARDQITQQIMRILEAQKIISADTLFQLADHLESVARGGKLNNALVAKLAGRISEIQLPRPTLSATEKNSIAFGYWTQRHIEDQRRLNIRAAVEKAAGDPEKLKDARGMLAPLLRDTLLAYNYAYYAPPGSQILYTNSVFVRSHDFIGNQGANHTWRQTEVLGSGWPSSGGGRLVGSLSTLPYALAEAEQNFLVPTQTQALIWADLVPQMILSAKIPRWWNVTPSQVHWVGLHIRYGRALLAESAFDPALRTEVLEELSMLAAPVRTREVGRLLEQGNPKDAIEQVTPSELFLLARELSAKRAADGSCLGAEIRELAQASPREINYEVISRAFGSPKPTLATSYGPELMNLRTFPTLMGYSSRIMAESWESNTLYWAALADELAVRPAELNIRIPEWTQKLVEQIFASHLEDWPAVLKSLRVVGEDVRAKSRAASLQEQKAALQVSNPVN